MEALTSVMIVRYRTQLLLVLFFVLFTCGLFPASVSAEMRLFELQHRPVGELAEMVRSLLGEEFRIAAYRNTLVVNASPAALDEVARLVASYDRSKRMLRVTIDQSKTFSEYERAVSSSGRLQNDDSRIVFGPSGKNLLKAVRQLSSIPVRIDSSFVALTVVTGRASRLVSLSLC
jgi:type II secretory pathway component GspD/PulD (secretin)